MIEEHPDVTKAKATIAPMLQAIDDAYRSKIELLQIKVKLAEMKTDYRAAREYQGEMAELVQQAQRERRMVIQPVIDIMNLVPPMPTVLDAISPPPLDSGRG